jgi:acetyl-CoA C-acetyltransferase
MEDIVILGLGQTPVGEHWELSLRQLGVQAIRAAIADAGGLAPQAMYIGSYLTSMVSRQANLGALLTDESGYRGIEGFTVEAAEASSLAALRMAFIAVRSGYIDTALAVGVEKATDKVGDEVDAALAQSADYDYEGMQGVTMMTQAGLLKQRYLYQHHLPADALAPFPLIAHENAVGNPNAMYRRAISFAAYQKAAPISPPLTMLDMAAYADGAAAVLVTRASLVPHALREQAVRITASAVAIDRLALHDRPDPLAFSAAAASFNTAIRKAGILPEEIDLLEIDDAFSIYATLSLEAIGFAAPGESPRLAQEGVFSRTGKTPILSMGGRKARGNALGASGLYQVVETCLQMRGAAGACQLPVIPRKAVVQSLGGPASTAVTVVLEK